MDLTILFTFGACAVLTLMILAAVFLLRRRRAAKQEKAAPKVATKQPAERTASAEAPPVSSPKPSPPAAPVPAAPPVAKPAPPPPPAAKSYSQNTMQEKIRILVVDDNPDTREHVSRLLYFEKDMEVMGQAVNGRQGIEMAARLKPHIVLMDINMPDVDGITACREMGQKTPFSQVIIMSVQAEQHYMRQAMAAGARDFQPKPFTSDELNNCIRRVYTMSLPIYRQLESAERQETQRAAQPQVVQEEAGEKTGRIIAVYSPKGGTGTSTLAANLAVALQQEVGDVVLLDADLQFGDILVHLNTKATRTISDLMYEGEFDIELLPDILLPHNSGLKLLLAPARPELADAILPPMLAKIMEGLKRQFKLVVVDTDNHLGDKTMSVVEQADYLLVVATPELPAIKSTKSFLEIAHLLELGGNQLSVVINRVGIPGGVAADKIEKVLKLDHTYHVPYDPRIHLAINRGVAVTQQDTSAPSAQAITAMAQDIWQRLVGAKPVTVPEKEVA